MSKHYSFLLENQEFKVPADYDFLNKIGKNIANYLIKYDNYLVKSNVHPQNFQAFLSYLTTKNYQLEINSENYHDYYLINEEFNHILSDILSNPKYDLLHKESILNILISKRANDKSSIEKYIATKLDYYLDNFIEKMSKIPFTSLYNIFNHENRELNDQQKAYQFIVQNIDQNDQKENKKSFCILLGSLEATKINEKSVKESILKQEERFGFAPKSSDSFICSVNKSINEVKNQIDNKFEEMFSFILKQQQQTFEKITQHIDEKLKTIEAKYDQLSNKIEKSNQSVNEIQNDTKNIYQKVEIINGIVQQNLNKINEIQNSFQKVEMANNDNEIKSSLQKLHDTIDSIQNSVQKVENASKEDDVKGSLQHLRATIDSIQKNCQQISQKTENINNCTQLHFKLEHDRFNGIINKLTEECGGNVHDKGVVNVTSSTFSEYQFKRIPKYAVDFKDNYYYFCSQDEPNSWLQYDFKEKKVCPTHYSIRTANIYGKGDWNLMSWIIEGSNNEKDWVELDYRKKVSDLDNFNAVQTFDIQKPSNEFFRFLRIKSINVDSHGQNHMLFSALEYFGSIM